MSDENLKPVDEASPALSQVTSELKSELSTAEDDLGGIDFDRMEKMLMARVEAESSRRRFRARASYGVGALAVAAAAAFFIGRAPHVSEMDGNASNANVADPGAGELESGSVTTPSAHAIGHGESLHRGDEIETAHAVFRASGRVVYEVNGGASGAGETARVRVSETDRPIVLALTQGVVEAQVDKVASGEAFAIDSDTVRIAVHGTHLRVARSGKHVTLDLTEGIVNIGHAPKSGSTYGTLVTAPAHAELDVDALETSLVITKDASKVRAADDLSATTASNAGLGAVALDPENRGAVAAPEHVVHAEKKAISAPPPSVKDPVALNNAPAVVAPVLPPREAIGAAVDACLDDKLSPGLVKVSVASTLSLRVGDDGYVQAARFEPPLDPEVQKCAAATIYKVHFTEPGSVMLTITR